MDWASSSGSGGLRKVVAVAGKKRKRDKKKTKLPQYTIGSKLKVRK